MAGRPKDTPNMTATLERHIDYAPSQVHYDAAAKGLKKLGIQITAKEIPKCHHIRELAIWVDVVMWCAGETTSRTSMLDRMIPKQSRMVVESQVTVRRPMSEAKDVPIDHARAYMEALEGPVSEPEDERPDDETLH